MAFNFADVVDPENSRRRQPGATTSPVYQAGGGFNESGAPAPGSQKQPVSPLEQTLIDRNGGGGAPAPTTTTPEGPTFGPDRDSLTKWFQSVGTTGVNGAAPDPSVLNDTNYWVDRALEKGDFSQGAQDYWKYRAQSNPDLTTGYYADREAGKVGFGQMFTPTMGAAPVPVATSGGVGSIAGPDYASKGAGGPDWVQIAGGGWVPPSHPLAQEAIAQAQGQAPSSPPVSSPVATTQPIPTPSAPVEDAVGQTAGPDWASKGAGGPDWVRVAGGGWVPPNHPLAQEAQAQQTQTPAQTPAGTGGQTVEPVHATLESAGQDLLDTLTARSTGQQTATPAEEAAVDPNNPLIRKQTDAYNARQEAAARNYLRSAAEQAGPLASSNLSAEERAASERVGQNTADFESQLMTRELQAQRDEIQSALQQLGSTVSDQQRQALELKLANIDAALQRDRLSQEGTQFSQSLAQSGSQFEKSLAQREAEFARQMGLSRDQLGLSRDTLGQRAYEFDTDRYDGMFGY